MEGDLERLRPEERRELSTKLIDHLLSLGSKESRKVPTEFIKLVLIHWQRDELETGEGLGALIKAFGAVDPGKAAELLKEVGLRDVAERLETGIGGLR